MATTKTKAAPAAAAAPATASFLLTLDELVVRDGFNPRTTIEQTSLAELASSIVARGMLTPLMVQVRKTRAGKWVLVAGHRRVAAVQLAIKDGQLPKDYPMPAVERDVATELEDAVAENFNREDLNPLEEARAFGRLRDDRGLTVKGIAEAVGVAQRRVTERLRILECPPKLHEKFATGELSAQAAKDLAELTKFDERLAVLTGNQAAQGSGRRSIASMAAWTVLHGNGKKDQLTVLTPRGGKARVSVDSLGELPKALAEKIAVIQRVRDAAQGYRGGTLTVDFDESALDALRAAGVVYEAKDDYGDRTLICKDRALLRSTAEPIIERAHAAAVKRDSELRRAAAKGPEAAAKADERAKAYAEQVAAREFNLALGDALAKAMPSIDFTLDTVKFICRMAIHAANAPMRSGAESLAVRGLRYVLPHWQDEIQQKNGKVKVRYTNTRNHMKLAEAAKKGVHAADTSPEDLFWDWWNLAATPQDVLARTMVAFAAAHYVDERAVAHSSRAHMIPETQTGVNWSAGSGYGPNELGKLLETILGKHVPGPAKPKKKPRAAASGTARKAPEKRVSPQEAATKVRALITEQPGITIPELAEKTGVKQNILYRVLPGLEQDGLVRKEGRGWHTVGADPERAEQTELTGEQAKVLHALVAGVVPKARQSHLAAVATAAGLSEGDSNTALAALAARGLVAGGNEPYATKQGGEVAEALGKAA